MAKKRYQKALYWDEDGSVRHRKLTIETGLIDDEKNGQAWHLFERFLVYFPQLGQTMPLLSPRTEIPISPFIQLKPKELAKVKDIEAIASENLEIRDVNADKDKRQNRNAEMIKIAIICVSITFLLVMVMKGCGSSMGNLKQYLPG